MQSPVPADFVDDAGHLSYLSVYMRSLESRAFVAFIMLFRQYILSNIFHIPGQLPNLLKMKKSSLEFQLVFSGRWMTTIPSNHIKPINNSTSPGLSEA